MDPYKEVKWAWSSNMTQQLYKKHQYLFEATFRFKELKDTHKDMGLSQVFWIKLSSELCLPPELYLFLMFMLWLSSIQFETLPCLQSHQSGIWNILPLWFQYPHYHLELYSLHPQLVLAGLYGSRNITATQFVQESWITWRAISDL